MIATTFIAVWLAFAGPGAAVSDTPLADCRGALSQGGLIICTGEPGSTFALSDGRRQTAGPEGLVTFGLAQDAPVSLDVSYARPGQPLQALEILPISARKDEYRVIEGFDCDKVDARTEEQKEHAARSWVTKSGAFATFSRSPSETRPYGPWLRPSEGRASSPFGPTRKYIGVSAVTGEPCESMSVHRGYDIAAPVGTEIIAPLAGTVILADPDLYYEGGTVFLDHGFGLVSVFMHMSEVDVAVGEEVTAGSRLGATGNTGRTTGPHLHWAVKWRDPENPDRGADFYIDPALLLDLK